MHWPRNRRCVNVHIESGSGTTVDTTGLGNLVIGYDEDSANPAPIDANRTGSHNLIIGPDHEFVASGGLLAGYGNAVDSNYGGVSGGGFNIASGISSSVSGGSANTASGFSSSVGGGAKQTASGTNQNVN